MTSRKVAVENKTKCKQTLRHTITVPNPTLFYIFNNDHHCEYLPEESF